MLAALVPLAVGGEPTTVPFGMERPLNFRTVPWFAALRTVAPSAAVTLTVEIPVWGLCGSMRRMGAFDGGNERRGSWGSPSGPDAQPCCPEIFAFDRGNSRRGSGGVLRAELQPCCRDILCRRSGQRRRGSRGGLGRRAARPVAADSVAFDRGNSGGRSGAVRPGDAALLPPISCLRSGQQGCNLASWIHGVALRFPICRGAGWKYGCGTRRPGSSPSRPPGTRRRCTPAVSPPTTRPTWATPPPSRPGTCWSARGSTPGTTWSTPRTSPTWTTRCSSGPSATARTGGSSRCRETERFRGDMEALRNLPPTHFIGAVEAIGIIDAFAERLAARGSLYDLDGDVYFARGADQAFGALSGPGTASGLSVEQMTELSAERGGDPDRPGKKDPLDPLVWRAERPGEPAWDVPLRPRAAGLARGVRGDRRRVPRPVLRRAGGRQRPGVPAPRDERFARAGGLRRGRVRPASTRTPAWSATRARRCPSRSATWSSSPGCARTGVDPMAIRLALLAHHYKSDWEWTDDELARAQARLDRWRAAVAVPAGPGRADGGRRPRDRPRAAGGRPGRAGRAGRHRRVGGRGAGRPRTAPRARPRTRR